MAWQSLEVFQTAERYLDYGKRFEPWSISCLSCVIARMRSQSLERLLVVTDVSTT